MRYRKAGPQGREVFFFLFLFLFSISAMEGLMIMYVRKAQPRDTLVPLLGQHFTLPKNYEIGRDVQSASPPPENTLRRLGSKPHSRSSWQRARS